MKEGLVRESMERQKQPFWPATAVQRTLLFCAVVLAGVLRCVELRSLFPVLVDEAIYLRWAEIISHSHTWFISLLDAKPPLAYWIYAAFRLPFAGDPLLGNRLVSVIAGMICVVFLYRVGFLCGGRLAGLVTALLYAVLPYGVLYDRIAYVDSLVNLFGVLLVYVSLRGFGGGRLPWPRAIGIGLTFGLALFTKTTILLFALAPVAIGWWMWRGSRWTLAARLSAVYAVAALFPLASRFAVPPGPAFPINNVLIHHTSFFTPVGRLIEDPLFNLRENGPLLAGYAGAYVTYPLLISAFLATLALLWRRERIPVVILLVCVSPFLAALLLLEYFPSRYAFPHAWPLLLVVGCAVGAARGRARTVASLTAGILLVALTIRSGRLIRAPEATLHATDAEEFLGSGPYSGFGVREAIERLRMAARDGPITILTDPWWGPPTDAVFAYLNEYRGTRVYEAWWLQSGGDYPLAPRGEMPVWKSQYQRVPAGQVDFSATPNLYYVTDTSYHAWDGIRRIDPNARLVQRFPKRDAHESIDVYAVN